MSSDIITREMFVLTIEAIRTQMTTDKLNSSVLSDVFPGSELATYNNSMLIKGILDLLRYFFPRDEDGFCELEHYCFDLDFGKTGEEIESIGAFYDRLTGQVETPELYAKQDNTEVIKHISSTLSHLP